MSYKPQEVLKRLEDLITEYNKNRSELDDDTISDMRASLATGTYLFVENAILPAMEDAVLMELAERRAEAKAFDDAFKKLLSEGYSKSQSESIARKHCLGDETYLEAVSQSMTSKNIVKIYDLLLKQANQVLNSMGKRTNYM